MKHILFYYIIILISIGMLTDIVLKMLILTEFCSFDYIAT